jgi:hypothetical protein
MKHGSETLDEPLVLALAKRGVGSVYMPVREYLRGRQGA